MQSDNAQRDFKLRQTFDRLIGNHEFTEYIKAICNISNEK